MVITSIPETLQRDVLDDSSRRFREEREHRYISCWHLSEHESAAMWSLYSTGHGVAIVSSYRRMQKAITDDETIYVGQVSYEDYDTFVLPPGKSLPYLYKRESYEHEHEVRAIAGRWRVDRDPSTGSFYTLPSPEGIVIPVDLTTLIDQVRVSPEAPAWFADVVRDVSTRYGLNAVVEQSALDRAPLY